MSITADAVYENGTLKFCQALPLAEQERVRVTIESKGDGSNKLQSGLIALRQLCDTEPIHTGGSRFTREELHQRGPIETAC